MATRRNIAKHAVFLGSQIALCLLIQSACIDQAKPEPMPAIESEALLTSLGQNVALPFYQEFQAAAHALKNAADEHA